jgi:hypothetical protein
VVELDLALEQLDRAGGLALARDNGKDLGDRLARFGRRHATIGKPAMNRLDVLETGEAHQFARDHGSGAGDTGGDRSCGQEPQRGAVLERGGHPGSGIDREPADEEHRYPGDAERHDPIAATRRLARNCRKRDRRMDRHDALGALGRNHLRAEAARPLVRRVDLDHPWREWGVAAQRIAHVHPLMVRSSQPVGQQEIEREIEVDVRNAFDR